MYLGNQACYFFSFFDQWVESRTTDTQWRHKSKISEKLGRCGRQNLLRPYLKIWDWDWIFGRAVKAVSSLGVRSPWVECSNIDSNLKMTIAYMTSTKETYLLLPFAGSNKEATLVSRLTMANFRYAYYADNKKSCKNFFFVNKWTFFHTFTLGWILFQNFWILKN
jgi:hypothetical protein